MNIDGKTKIYGVIGKPVSHSLSPAMHNAAFARLGENRAYLAFPVTDVALAMQGLRGLNIEGVSVTIPHKEAVIPHLDTIHPVAQKIGAVNTIKCVLSGDGVKLEGYNTDWLGAIQPLQQKIELEGAEVVVLGAGGAARAIGFGLLEAGARISLCSRTEARGRALAGELQCPWHSLAEAAELKGSILINATSVGMAPEIEISLVPAGILNRFAVVMDIVYVPMKTRLLKDAENAGCRIINGLEMLLYQGMAQFEIWTGLKPPEEEMRKALLGALSA